MLYSMCLVLQLFKINITNNPCTETDQPKFAHLKKKKKGFQTCHFSKAFFPSLYKLDKSTGCW